MLIKKTAAGLATGAALILFMGAGAAQAGVSFSMTAVPNPSLAGQSVSLSASYLPGCPGAEVEFRDVTGGGSKALCSATMDGSGAVSCSTNGLTETGTRTIHSVVITPGTCLGWTAVATPQTVNAAPVTVPTTSEWTMWGLMGALLIGGGVFATRRFRNAAG